MCALILTFDVRLFARPAPGRCLLNTTFLIPVTFLVCFHESDFTDHVPTILDVLNIPVLMIFPAYPGFYARMLYDDFPSPVC